MAPFPSDDDVVLFKDFTSCPDNLVAIKFLQGASNVLDAAVNNYFENPHRYNQPFQGYDESAFSQNRYGNEPGDMPSFQIDSVDNANVYSSFSRSTAPTRPNSRNSNSSMRVLTDQQESGVVSNESRFGVATREHYDDSQWAMTVAETNAAEIYPDVELWDLVRQDQEPVFLKPQNSENLLPALLSIIGRIPLVQKVILEGPPMLNDYGSSGSWWSGTTIQSPQMADGEEDDDRKDDIEFLAEVQRLLVFLRSSERLHGSVEPLQSTNLMHAAYSSEHGVVAETEGARFLRACSIALGRHHDSELLSGIFRSFVVNNGVEIAFEELAIMSYGTTNPISLYEAVDNLIWESDPNGESDETRYLSKVAPVLVLHLKNGNASQWGLNINIPSEWFLDRYMADNQNATKEMRKSKAECRRGIQLCEKQMQKLQSFSAKHDSTVFAIDNVLGGAVSYLSQDLMTETDEEEDALADFDAEAQQCKALSDRLQKALDQLKGTITKLQDDKKDMEHKLIQLSEMLQTQSPMHEEVADLKHKYVLRGVSTKANNVYVPVSATTGDEEEWWKMQYDPTPMVDRRTLSLSDVLENASTESSEVLLVYGSEEACRVSDIVVPTALLDFVKSDNRIFKETREASTATTWHESAPDYATEPPPYEDEEMREDDPAISNQSQDARNAEPNPRSNEPGFDYDQEMRRDRYAPAVPSRPEGPV